MFKNRRELIVHVVAFAVTVVACVVICTLLAGVI